MAGRVEEVAPFLELLADEGSANGLPPLLLRSSNGTRSSGRGVGAKIGAEAVQPGLPPV